MPGMSGFEVCRSLRADPRHALLPVVMVTALDPAVERANGLDAGADDFLSKPINQAELLARVRSLLRVKALQDQLLRGPAKLPPVARRGEFDLLCLRWPALPDEAEPADPAGLLARQQALLDRRIALAAEHGGIVTNLHAQGLTVLFEHGPSPDRAAMATDRAAMAAERAWALAREVIAQSEGVCAGLARGSVTVGSLRSPDGAAQPVAFGAALQRAERLSREAAPNALCADPDLLAQRSR